MFDEDDLLPLSGLQHLVFCERQWALIHVEQVWSENQLTAEGRELHDRAHEAGSESRPGLRIARGLRLRSLRLGLSGQADVVEFRASPGGSRLPDAEGLWQPFPVEYKRGRPKRDRCDEVQLCAQALCLEEMFDSEIPAGALFYGTPRRRRDVAFSASLRAETEALAARMHLLYSARTTPRAAYEPKCERCSLLALCMPKTLASAHAVERYLARATASGRPDGAVEDEP
jgi:CRISPR-associated exonuclease Cas4